MAIPLPSKQFLRYFLVTIVALTIFGLLAFYFVLNKEKETISKNDEARGYTGAPRLDSTDENPNSATPNTRETLVVEENDSPKTPPRLWQVSRSPIAGTGFVASTTVTQLYFAERASGYIFAADVKKGSITRLSNRLFPKIYEAFFDERGGTILRSVNESGVLTTFSGVISVSSTTPALEGRYLDNDIQALSINRKTGEIFYLRSGGTGETIGKTADRDGAKQKIVFSSTLSNWLPEFLSDGRIFLTQKAADETSGYAYELKGGSLSPIVRDVPGLAILPRKDSSAVLFSDAQGNTIQLYAKVGEAIISLPLKTIADKCVWSSNPEGGKDVIAYCAVPQFIPSRNFLNDRYQGRVYTSDDWWRVNAEEGTVDLLYSPEEGIYIDVENPTIDKKDETIAFTNRRDKTLWVLRIGEK